MKKTWSENTSDNYKFYGFKLLDCGSIFEALGVLSSSSTSSITLGSCLTGLKIKCSNPLFYSNLIEKLFLYPIKKFSIEI